MQKPIADNGLIYLPNSRSLNAYDTLRSQYPIGLVDPYSLLVVTHDKSMSVYTAEYFALEADLISQFLSSNTKYVNAKSITSITFCNGEAVTYQQAMQYLNRSSLVYHTTAASNYRGLTASLTNSDRTVTNVQVTTIIDPDSTAIFDFIIKTRKLLTNFASSSSKYYITSSNYVDLYLFGGYTTTYDLEQVIYAQVPALIGITFAVVVLLIGIGFGSIALTFRLLITVGLSLTWAYGLMVCMILILFYCCKYFSFMSYCTV